ncbi:MAG: hypothetical protein KBT13_00260, partial [Bacteroidales bacterium]|nr:hypothetical protein [Candidatus Sodaliphilus limicaballi]
MDEIRQDLLNRVRQMEKDGVVTARHARELKRFIFSDAGHTPDEVEALLNAEEPVQQPEPEHEPEPVPENPEILEPLENIE